MTDKEIQPNYFAIIPANVRYDKNLKANEKLLFGEITALSNKTGECWATNEYFANLYDVKKNQVSVWINNLIKQGYLKSIIVYKNNSKQIDKRILCICDVKNNNTPITEKKDTYIEKQLDPIIENNDTPITENSEDNNTRYEYYKNNNKKEIIKEKENNFENKNEKSKSKSLDLSFIENNQFKDLVVQWINFKKEQFGFSYKSVGSLKVFYEKLFELSNGNIEKAKKIINKSIAFGYSGIFELENDKKFNSNKQKFIDLSTTIL